MVIPVITRPVLRAWLSHLPLIHLPAPLAQDLLECYKPRGVHLKPQTEFYLKEKKEQNSNYIKSLDDTEAAQFYAFMTLCKSPVDRRMSGNVHPVKKVDLPCSPTIAW